MKRLHIISLLTVLTVMLATARADLVNVLWAGLDGFYRSDESTPLLNPLGSGNSALYQLIFSTVDEYGTAGVGGTVSLNEQILDEYVNVEVGNNSNLYGEVPTQSYSGTFSPGWLYVRVFDQGTSSGGAGVVENTWYYNSPRVAAVDQTDPDDTQNLNIQGNNTIGGFGDALNLQVVPEPSILAFFGIGGLALAIRRRIKV